MFGLAGMGIGFDPYQMGLPLMSRDALRSLHNDLKEWQKAVADGNFTRAKQIWDGRLKWRLNPPTTRTPPERRPNKPTSLYGDISFSGGWSGNSGNNVDTSTTTTSTTNTYAPATPGGAAGSGWMSDAIQGSRLYQAMTPEKFNELIQQSQQQAQNMFKIPQSELSRIAGALSGAESHRIAQNALENLQTQMANYALGLLSQGVGATGMQPWHNPQQLLSTSSTSTTTTPNKDDVEWAKLRLLEKQYGLQFLQNLLGFQFPDYSLKPVPSPSSSPIGFSIVNPGNLQATMMHGAQQQTQNMQYLNQLFNQFLSNSGGFPNMPVGNTTTNNVAQNIGAAVGGAIHSIAPSSSGATAAAGAALPRKSRRRLF